MAISFELFNLSFAWFPTVPGGVHSIWSAGAFAWFTWGDFYFLKKTTVNLLEMKFIPCRLFPGFSKWCYLQPLVRCFYRQIVFFLQYTYLFFSYPFTSFLAYEACYRGTKKPILTRVGRLSSSIPWGFYYVPIPSLIIDTKSWILLGRWKKRWQN